MRDELSSAAPSLSSLLTNLRADIAPGNVAAFNRIVRASPTATLALNGKLVAFAEVNDLNVQEPSHYCLHLSIDNRQLKIWFSISMLTALYAGQATLKQAGIDLIELMVRHALDGHLDALEKRSGKPVTVRIEPDLHNTNVALNIKATMEGDPAPHSVLVSGDFDLAETFLDLCKTGNKPAKCLSAPLDAEISTAAAFLDQEDAQQVTVGDVLFLSERSQDELFFLKVGGTVLSAIHPRNEKMIIGPKMDQNTVKPEAVEAAASDTLVLEKPQMSKSQVHLTIELGRWKVALDDVQKISEGMLFELGDVDTDNATLRINGDVVASGSLISVGDGVGLRIKSVI